MFIWTASLQEPSRFSKGPFNTKKALELVLRGRYEEASCKNSKAGSEVKRVMAGKHGGAPRVDEQQALVAQDAGVVHNERAGLLWEVAEADCIRRLPPRLQLCFPLLFELVEGPSDSIHNHCRHSMKGFAHQETLCGYAKKFISSFHAILVPWKRHDNRSVVSYLLSSFMAAACSWTSSITSLTCSSCIRRCDI